MLKAGNDTNAAHILKRWVDTCIGSEGAVATEVRVASPFQWATNCTVAGDGFVMIQGPFDPRALTVTLPDLAVERIREALDGDDEWVKCDPSALLEWAGASSFFLTTEPRSECGPSDQTGVCVMPGIVLGVPINRRRLAHALFHLQTPSTAAIAVRTPMFLTSLGIAGVLRIRWGSYTIAQVAVYNSHAESPEWKNAPSFPPAASPTSPTQEVDHAA